MNPLDQLNPLHLPPPPGWWPPAPGWWLVSALALAMLAAFSLWLARRHRARAYRREALALATACSHDRNFGGLLNLIRRTAKTTAPDSDWPSRDATTLLQRLDRWSDGQLGRQLFSNDPNLLTALANDYYRHQTVSLSDNQWHALSTWTRHWIKRHQARDLLGEVA